MGLGVATQWRSEKREKLREAEAEGRRREGEQRGVVEALRGENAGLLRSQRELQESVGRCCWGHGGWGSSQQLD